MRVPIWYAARGRQRACPTWITDSPDSSPVVGAFACAEVAVPDRDEISEALTHATAAAERDWAWIDGLLDMWLESAR